MTVSDRFAILLLQINNLITYVFGWNGYLLSNLMYYIKSKMAQRCRVLYFFKVNASNLLNLRACQFGITFIYFTLKNEIDQAQGNFV